MPNRSIRDERQATDRPKAGPADPATQRRKLAEYEASAHKEAVERVAKHTEPATEPSPTRDLSAVGAARNLTGGRRRKIADALKDAGA